MVYVEDLIDEMRDIPNDMLEEIQFVFQRYGVDAEIIGDKLDIDLDLMVNLTEEERVHLYGELYSMLF